MSWVNQLVFGTLYPCEKRFPVQYAMLLKPHSNVRYRHSLEKLAMTELSCVLNAWKLPSDMELRSLGGEPFLVFSAPELNVQIGRAHV